MIDQVTYLMNSYPLLQDIISFLIICRVLFKPTFALLEKYVDITVNEDDNRMLSSFMNSRAYKTISFILDLTISIKLPKTKKEK